MVIGSSRHCFLPRIPRDTTIQLAPKMAAPLIADEHGTYCQEAEEAGPLHPVAFRSGTWGRKQETWIALVGRLPNNHETKLQLERNDCDGGSCLVLCLVTSTRPAFMATGCYVRYANDETLFLVLRLFLAATSCKGEV